MAGIGLGVFLTQTVLAEDLGQGFGWFKESRYQHRIEQGSGEKDESRERIREQIREERLEHQAEFLGMTVEELEEALKEKTFHELVEEAGKTEEEIDAWHEEMQKERQDHMTEMWKEKGLTDEEIAERLEEMQERHEEMEKYRSEHEGEEPFGPKGFGGPHHE